MSDAFQDVTAPPRVNPLTDSARRPKTTRRVRPGSRSSSPPRAATTARPGKPDAIDFSDRINGLLQTTFAIPLATAGMMLRNRALLADADVVATQGPRFAVAVNELAQENQQVRQIVERVTKLGPYGALLEPLVMAAVQIVTNHKQELLRITSKLGAKSLDKIVGTQEEFENELRLMAVTSVSSNGQG